MGGRSRRRHHQPVVHDEHPRLGRELGRRVPLRLRARCRGRRRGRQPGSGTNIIGAPATIPGVLTVGGVDQTGTASIEASTQGITIGISAPSEGLLGVSADGEVVSWSGTSGAAPIVAGVAALIRSAHPDISANDVINRIIKTAMPVADAQKPRDPLYGFGLVDADAAISANIPTVSENPMGDLAEWVRLFRRADSAPTPSPPSPRGHPAAAGCGCTDRARFTAASQRRFPALRYPAAHRPHGPWYPGSAWRHRSCPAHPIGARSRTPQSRLRGVVLLCLRTALCPRS